MPVVVTAVIKTPSYNDSFFPIALYFSSKVIFDFILPIFENKSEFIPLVPKT